MTAATENPKINYFAHGSVILPNRAKFNYPEFWICNISPSSLSIPNSSLRPGQAIRLLNSSLISGTLLWICSYLASTPSENMTYAWFQYVYEVYPMFGFNIYTIFTRMILLGKWARYEIYIRTQGKGMYRYGNAAYYKRWWKINFMKWNINMNYFLGYFSHKPHLCSTSNSTD